MLFFAINLNSNHSGYNMDISVISPLVIREEQRSYETGIFNIHVFTSSGPRL